MKKTLKFIPFLMAGAFFFTSCKKDSSSSPDVISQQTLEQISAHGFGTSNVQKVDEGYIVEGDIVLTQEYLNQLPTGNFLRIANNEQYRTT
ncbi:MAG TPA: hypothetical protein VK489_13985, partial [Ferruginibacter sp.]|nr:hypothetical protein [Ferruginibacter sp.]